MSEAPSYVQPTGPKKEDERALYNFDDTPEQLGVARGCNGPVFLGSSNDNYTCYGCGERLSWVKPFKRTVCGVTRPVKAHFRHISKKKGVCNGETARHEAAKHAAATANLKYFVTCCELGCNELIPVQFPEHAVYEVECRFLDYRLDAGVKDGSGNVVGAIEILETHPIGKAKVDDLALYDVAWVEATARSVLGAVEAKQAACLATRCAFMRCDTCEEKIRIRKLKEEETRIEATADVERRAKAALTYRERTYAAILGSQDALFWKVCLDAAADKLGVERPDWDAERAARIVEQASIDDYHIKQGSPILDFGKHRDRPMASIMDEEPGYIRWVAYWTGSRDGNKPEERRGLRCVGVIEEEARKLLKGKCLLCFDETGADWKNWCSECYRKS